MKNSISVIGEPVSDPMLQVGSSPIQVNNVLNYQNYEHFREIAG